MSLKAGDALEFNYVCFTLGDNYIKVAVLDSPRAAILFHCLFPDLIKSVKSV